MLRSGDVLLRESEPRMFMGLSRRVIVDCLTCDEACSADVLFSANE